jgi:pyocin large subunit-like protein
VKHANEFGSITRNAYLQRARTLLGSDVGGDISGVVRPNGDVLRYNSVTNEFAVGRADGTIRTYFRPIDGVAYWKRQVGP